MTMVQTSRIRSTHQRRVLDWLADGGGTVTEVSLALNIRVPHASAALKKLRESGDVIRDEANIRGSRYRLSSQGLARLESDGIARMTELVQWPPPPGAAGIVLARDGPMMLLGYASQPAGPLLGIPDRPMDEGSGVLLNSNGNDGEPEVWRWAVQRGDGPVWWDIETLRRTSAPTQSSPTTLTAWMERPKVMGLVRARLLDEGNPWPVSVGSWFSPLPSGFWPDLPQVLQDGDSVIGRAGNSGPPVKPRGAIQAVLGRSLDRSIVATNMAENAVSIIDGNLIGVQSKPLPFAILKYWLSIIHPRMSSLALDMKFTRLIEDLNSRSSNALTRRVLSDFPGREWGEGIGSLIDTRHLSQRAGEACLLFALEEIDAPIILDWRWKYVEALDRLGADQRCRVIISNDISLDISLRLTTSDTPGKFNLEIPGRINIPITVSRDSMMPTNWQAPKTPDELTRGSLTNVKNAENSREAMWLACQLAEGDDVWADRHEREYPLASWIATTGHSQPSRWRRIGDSIDPKWASLADLTTFADEDLSNLAMYDDHALSILIDRLREHPLSSLARITTKPSVATAILLSREWIEEIPDVVDTWLEQPLRASEVIRKNWREGDIARIASACPQHKLLLEDNVVDRTQMLAIMEDVHYSLWEDKSESWLLNCLASSVGRTALSSLEIPWPVILSKKDISSEDLALVHHMPNGVGKDYLIDSLMGITASEQGIHPSLGKTHPFAGWLFKDSVPMVPLETKHDLDIHIELHRRFQQQ
ncbi:MAG: ArsR/SmtB family transcription factor [Candidatus Poseidoniaceae archaeon]